jgi:hypothetical protein
MIVPPLICPACEGAIPWTALHRGHLTCPGCSCHFRISRAYFGTIGWMALGTATFLVWIVRPVFDGVLFAAVAIAFVPIAAILSTIVRRFFPPALEMDDGGLAEYLHNDHSTDDDA